MFLWSGFGFAIAWSVFGETASAPREAVSQKQPTLLRKARVCTSPRDVSNTISQSIFIGHFLPELQIVGFELSGWRFEVLSNSEPYTPVHRRAVKVTNPRKETTVSLDSLDNFVSSVEPVPLSAISPRQSMIRSNLPIFVFKQYLSYSTSTGGDVGRHSGFWGKLGSFVLLGLPYIRDISGMGGLLLPVIPPVPELLEPIVTLEFL